LEVVRRPKGSTEGVLLPNSQDYEHRMDSSESMFRVSAMHLMLKRLKPSKVYRPFRYRTAA
jgi:hypothetical protein